MLHVIYWWKGDNFCCLLLVFEVRRLHMISDRCLMGGNDGIYIEMHLKSYLIGSLAVVNVYLTCMFLGYLFYKPNISLKCQFPILASKANHAVRPFVRLFVGNLVEATCRPFLKRIIGRMNVCSLGPDFNILDATERGLINYFWVTKDESWIQLTISLIWFYLVLSFILKLLRHHHVDLTREHKSVDL